MFAFEESKHKRDASGKFAKKEGTGRQKEPDKTKPGKPSKPKAQTEQKPERPVAPTAPAIPAAKTLQNIISHNKAMKPERKISSALMRHVDSALKSGDPAQMVKALQGVLHHDRALKPQHKLSPALIRDVESSIKKMGGGSVKSSNPLEGTSYKELKAKHRMLHQQWRKTTDPVESKLLQTALNRLNAQMIRQQRKEQREAMEKRKGEGRRFALPYGS